MDLHDFYYDLPEELIAQDPLSDRSSSRLMVLDKETGEIEHKIFRDIVDYLKPGDCLVVNDTKVIPARLIGTKADTGATIEVLLLKRLEDRQDTWEVLVKPGKKAKVGAKISFGEGKLIGEIIDIVEEGNRLIQFTYDGIFEEILDELGQMPLPPYITHKLEDKNRYQTVYAKHEGSAAAPTAGLHFTTELLEKIKAMGVNIARVTLHVGLGTFRPVKVENILDHHMHSEFYVVTQEAADMINNTRKNGGRVIAVGTTSTRTLESVALEDGTIPATSGWTEIFIYPGYKFKAIDCLITNFHLPESTLVMLVSALAGREHVLHAYEVAVQEKYRFFSFGDCGIAQNGGNADCRTDQEGGLCLGQKHLCHNLKRRGTHGLCRLNHADFHFLQRGFHHSCDEGCGCNPKTDNRRLGADYGADHHFCEGHQRNQENQEGNGTEEVDNHSQKAVQPRNRVNSILIGHNQNQAQRQADDIRQNCRDDCHINGFYKALPDQSKHTFLKHILPPLLLRLCL